jgi:hypothetical protein
MPPRRSRLADDLYALTFVILKKLQAIDVQSKLHASVAVA